MASEESPNLKLPYILAAQAQKHVTHNEAVRALDALVQLAVIRRDYSSPPVLPVDGERYIVGPSAAVEWSGREGDIAARQDGSWSYFSPMPGWIAWVGEEAKAVVLDGADWVDLALATVNPVGSVGISATADSTNRLVVASPASLFTHDGGGHQMKLNKAGAGDTLSQLYQTGWSGRAETGLTGDDDFRLKVSPDGSTWHEAMVVDRHSGAISLPKTPSRVILRIFTSSGVWVKPAGLKNLHVWGVGGGAGTPDVTASSGEIALSSGGGSGTFGWKAVSANLLGASEEVTVGSGGTAVSNAGGTTSFGAHMTLPGAGTPASISSGTSGTTTGVGNIAASASGADWSVRGAYPPRGRRSSSTEGLAGNGASSAFGSGGVGSGNGGNGFSALTYGAGAGGACANSATTRLGGNGGAGILFVEEHY
jgi:hypothetical protein